MRKKRAIVPNLTNMTVEKGGYAEIEKAGLHLADEIEYSLSDTVAEKLRNFTRPYSQKVVAKILM